MACGFTVNAVSRQYLMEPLAARPLSYVKYAMVGGYIMFQWDYFRRNMMEAVLEGEEKMKYYTTM